MASEFDRSIIGSEFDRTVFGPVTEAEIRAYAEASGEPPAVPGPELTAPPTFIVRLRGRRFMPEHLVRLGRYGFDAGKDIEFGVPVRVGDVLLAVSTVHDFYEKTGRSGDLAFVVLRAVVTNQRNEHVVTIDQRMMFK